MTNVLDGMLMTTLPLPVMALLQMELAWALKTKVEPLDSVMGNRGFEMIWLPALKVSVLPEERLKALPTVMLPEPMPAV